ncbi:hypothetical protein [Thermococcus sp.]|uniref:hypothetical protein n=1 Tax=Thermococcus sp. TaxID=35749 RepID=UPI0026110BB1|nr:hypothetical protein [Thermococcus sp.]
MGAMDAFSRTFTLVIQNKKLYLLPLVMSLILAPLSAYMVGNSPFLQNNPLQSNQTHSGDVIIEEHGSLAGETTHMSEFLKILAIYGVIALVLSSIFQYSVIKGLLKSSTDSEYSLFELAVDGIKHFPGVLILNLIFTLISLLLVALPLLLVGIGVILGGAGLILVILGLLLLILVATLSLSLTVLPVPIYAEKGSLGPAFEALGFIYSNMKTAMVFGLLIFMILMAIEVAAAPISMITQITASKEVSMYVSALAQAPLDALLYFFVWSAGVALYRELRRLEDLKKVDMELDELGLEF